MEGRSWLRETLKIWLQYLAAGWGILTAVAAYISILQVGLAEPRTAKVVLVAMTVLYGYSGWVIIGVWFEAYAIVRKAQEARRLAEAAHEQDSREAPEADRLKAETRRLIESMRAA